MWINNYQFSPFHHEVNPLYSLLSRSKAAISLRGVSITWRGEAAVVNQRMLITLSIRDGCVEEAAGAGFYLLDTPGVPARPSLRWACRCCPRTSTCQWRASTGWACTGPARHTEACGRRVGASQRLPPSGIWSSQELSENTERMMKKTEKRFRLGKESSKPSWLKSPGVAVTVEGFCWAIWKINQNCIQDSNFCTVTEQRRFNAVLLKVLWMRACSAPPARRSHPFDLSGQAGWRWRCCWTLAAWSSPGDNTSTS